MELVTHYDLELQQMNVKITILNGESLENIYMTQSKDFIIKGKKKILDVTLENPFRACSVSSQSMWIEWDWIGLNPKQVKLLLKFFQSRPIHG
jgi:hypothetical protein